MNTPEIKAFIESTKHLFWYIPENQKEGISHELLVEIILNYGTLDEIKNLIKILGINEMSRIFFSACGRKQMNYFPEVYHFFSLFFEKYA